MLFKLFFLLINEMIACLGFPSNHAVGRGERTGQVLVAVEPESGHGALCPSVMG